MSVVGEPIEVVLFDLGNVLVDFDHMIAAGRIARFCQKSPSEIFDLFFTSDITMRFEAGSISRHDFFDGVKKMLDAHISYNSFVHIWNEIFFLSQKNRQVYSIVNSLHSSYRTGLISNINILHYEYLKKHFPVFGVFDKVFTSCELGAVKPDPEIYRKALEYFAVEPGKVFYTDDRQELVSSAQNMGIKSFVFRGVQQLKNDLLASGITIH